MKIAYLLGEYPSLSETFIAREIEALRRRGFEIGVWAWRAGEGARTLPQLSSAQCLARPLARLAPSMRAKYWRHVGTHWAQIEKENLREVRHIHAGWASFPADIARGAAEVLGVPWSFSGHARDLWVEGGNLKGKLSAAKFAGCCTRSGAEYLRRLAPNAASKVLYAPHGIEINRYQYRERPEMSAPPHVLAVGRLVAKKGFEDLLCAVSLLKAECPVNATIIGEGGKRAELEKLIVRLQLQSVVSLPGACPHEIVIAAMQRADLLVAPSTRAADGDRDGLPNVLLEAAACGLPIVSSRAGSVTDFLDEGCAWLHEPGDANALAEALRDVIGNYSESVRRAEAARARVERNFDIERNIEVLAQAFQSE
jgi:glycosyltransferase involved in cell wall biosynthesis